jgi:hypothetical protein
MEFPKVSEFQKPQVTQLVDYWDVTQGRVVYMTE